MYSVDYIQASYLFCKNIKLKGKQFQLNCTQLEINNLVSEGLKEQGLIVIDRPVQIDFCHSWCLIVRNVSTHALWINIIMVMVNNCGQHGTEPQAKILPYLTVHLAAATVADVCTVPYIMECWWCILTAVLKIWKFWWIGMGFCIADMECDSLLMYSL